MSDQRPGVLILRPAAPAGFLTYQEVAERCGVQVGFIHRLLEVGILERTSAEWPGCLHAEATLRVRQVVRLQEHLGVNLDGAAIILDLLERIEALENELAHRSG